MSLVEKLTARFQNHEGQWIAGGQIEKWVLANTDQTASNARRRLREMVENGVLEQKEESKNGVNHAYYRLSGTVEKPKERKVEFVTIDGQTVVREIFV